MAGGSAEGRRAFLIAAVAAVAAGPARADGVYVVSRDRVLREAAAARALVEAEATQSAALQDLVNRTKEDLAEEEEALTRQRGELDDAEFQDRVARFDQRMRTARRVTQERATVLQQAFRDARADLVARLPGVIEAVRLEMGATLILNADAVLAWEDAVDVTDRVIARLDAVLPAAPIPRIDVLDQILGPDPAE